jgi:hypothetical protein
MAYPTLEQYSDALQFPSKTIKDPSISSGSVEKTGYGTPFARSGGFALTYKLTVNGKDYALRCFQTERKGLAERYGAISRALEKSNLNELVEFKFNPAGIVVQTKTYPTVKMAWAKGSTLGVYIEKNRNSPTELKKLQTQLRNLSKNLRTAGIAHGDIQAGNIMVLDSGKLKLVDYDAFFVPEIRNLGAIETGHANFQHPQRGKVNPYNETIDDFSFILIDTALELLMKDSKLWDSTSSDPEGIIFRASDLSNPHKSENFHKSSSVPIVGKKVLQLAQLATEPITNVPNLDDWVAGKTSIAELKLKPLALTSKSGTTSSKGSASTSSTSSASVKYVPAYGQILDASDFRLCLKKVGTLAEVVGQVKNIKFGTTKYGRPFVHLIFGLVTGPAFQVTIWEEGLNNLKSSGKTITDSWKGSWLSVNGIIDPMYSTKTWNRVSITVVDPQQIVKLGLAEAHLRLGSVGVTSTAKGSTATTKVSQSQNKSLASSISSKPTPAKTTQPRKSTSASSSSRSNYSSSRYSSSYNYRPRKKGFFEQYGGVIFWGVAIFVLFAACSG